MVRVPRTVRVIKEQGDEELGQAQPLVDFRDTPAWILLGEPGAGKSETLKGEAWATGGLYLTAVDLLSSEPPPNEWHGHTLYIDALDEVRASGPAGLLERIRSKLGHLDSPPFRLACRAADWYGPSDRSSLQHQSPNDQLVVLQLCPLSPEDIRWILHDNHGIQEPQPFIEQAERQGIAPLLENPQTLELLAKAIRGSDWPESRAETYHLACTQLVQEANRRHRDLRRQHPQFVDPNQLLLAAGQLCAVLLLSGKSGVAMDDDAASEHFPTLEQFAPPELRAAREALGSKLFMPAPGHEERLIPSHRSIAEYLAADWLARQLDTKHLPLQRLLNLLLGADGGVVSDLRGLYAWLALHSIGVRSRLIEADPLSVILYGDARPMSPEDKRQLLNGLQEQAKDFAGYRWSLMHSLHPFGDLADTALVEDFRKVLLAPERDEASQSHADCVIEILGHGEHKEPAAQLGDVLLEVIKDASRWPKVRIDALQVWLTTCHPDAAIAILNQISQGQVEDDDDELAGSLLYHLYPSHLEADKLLKHLHQPKESRLSGVYVLFWDYELPKLAPDEHLPTLLDELAGKPEPFDQERVERHFFHLADELLARGLQVHGDAISGERLFEWLGVGADPYGNIQRDTEPFQKIRDWLGQRPDKYKEISKLCIEGNLKEQHYLYDDRLHNARIPNDIGLWHLEKAAHSEQAVAYRHLAYAVNSLINQQGAEGLTLESLEAWAESHPSKANELKSRLYCPVSEKRLEIRSKHSKREKERIERRQQRTEKLKPHLSAIREGKAAPGIFDALSNVWLKRFSDILGETLAERFASYSNLGSELMLAAESGIKLCPLRTGLPSVDEIIALNLEKRRYLISQPCLLGMELRWQEDRAGVRTLPEETLKCMIVFHLTDGMGETPEWFHWLVTERSCWVAEVLVAYASAALKAGEAIVSGISPLERNKHYSDVARISAPELLKQFPLRARKDQLNHLEHLLKAALHHAPEALSELIDKKLALKSLDSAQRVYWHATALLLDPEHHEAALWHYIGQSTTRANLLAGFLGADGGTPSLDHRLPPHTLSKLIELIAPHAEMERMSGLVTPAMQRGDLIRSMINRLSSLTSPEAARELDRLLGLATLAELKYSLESARHQQRVQQRETNYRFLPIEAVARILADREPASIEDLAALALDLLDDIAQDLRHANDDGVKAFWNIKGHRPESQREENLCRDTLLTRMRPRLDSLGIGIDPEVDHHNDKRADLCLSYRNLYALPIEIKRDSHRELWTALTKQLMDRYAHAPRSHGHGIYLVLWFGGEGMPGATDGGKKPRTPEELRERLEGQLSQEERQRIHVRVLDVSWPA